MPLRPLFFQLNAINAYIPTKNALNATIFSVQRRQRLFFRLNAVNAAIFRLNAVNASFFFQLNAVNALFIRLKAVNAVISTEKRS